VHIGYPGRVRVRVPIRGVNRGAFGSTFPKGGRISIFLRVLVYPLGRGVHFNFFKDFNFF